MNSLFLKPIPILLLILFSAIGLAQISGVIHLLGWQDGNSGLGARPTKAEVPQTQPDKGNEATSAQAPSNPTANELVKRCDELLAKYADIVKEAQKATNNYDEPRNFQDNPYAGRILTEKDYHYFAILLNGYESGLAGTTVPQQLPIKHYFYIKELRGIITNQPQK